MIGPLHFRAVLQTHTAQVRSGHVSTSPSAPCTNNIQCKGGGLVTRVTIRGSEGLKTGDIRDLRSEVTLFVLGFRFKPCQLVDRFFDVEEGTITAMYGSTFPTGSFFWVTIPMSFWRIIPKSMMLSLRKRFV